jgi:hypoxanthine phosphoribosyltransferase
VIKKHYYSWQDIEKMCTEIVTTMYTSKFTPDYIVGITRGGNIPATIISNMTGIPCEAIKVSLRDDSKLESNSWMAEDAFGVVPLNELEVYKSRFDPHKRKKILIVDDINDTGTTFNWIINDWQSGCFSNEKDVWDVVWGNTVKFAVLTENLASNFDHVNFYAHEINKAEDDIWLVYPWENVGKYE